MKKKIQRYSFMVLSIIVIGLFFTFTGGVHDGNSVQLAPPTITFTASTIATSVPVSQRFWLGITIADNDPGFYGTTEICDFPPYPSSQNSTNVPDPKPEYKFEIWQSGTFLNVVPAENVNIDPLSSGSQSNLPIHYLQLNYSFNQPGVYEIRVSARTKTYTQQISINGNLQSGGGELQYSEWGSQSKFVTVTGTAVLPVQRYYFDRLTYIPAEGDPTPQKTYTFTDTARQYLDIISSVKANMKFYWIPPAADTVLYRNLASKYELNIENADYSVVDFDGNPATTGVNHLYLNYSGQRVAFDYFAEPQKYIVFSKPSKTIAGQDDDIVIYFK